MLMAKKEAKSNKGRKTPEATKPVAIGPVALAPEFVETHLKISATKKPISKR
jgi:hypothetical protein